MNIGGEAIQHSRRLANGQQYEKTRRSVAAQGVTMLLVRNPPILPFEPTARSTKLIFQLAILPPIDQGIRDGDVYFE